VFPNKYSLKIIINIKWLKNQSDLKQNKYESPTLVYCIETYAMVPLVRVHLEIPPRMQRSWSDDDAIMPKVVVESSRGLDSGLGPNIKGFSQYYHR
jgi:hypothetical protein